MLKLDLHANGNSDAESNDTLGFLKSLKELRELRSQIHHAADYCAKSFLKSEDKTTVLDNTREYICRAVVTVVDHLGSVSANLNRRIETTDRVAETELRINCLKQKLESCDQYNHNFTLTKLRWSTDLPRYHPRYIAPPSKSPEEVSLRLREANHPTDAIIVSKLESKSDAVIISKQEFKSDEDMPLFMYTSSKKICLDKSPRSPLEVEATDIIVMPVRDGFSVAPKLIRNPSFHFQESRKPGAIRRLLQWKSMGENEIVSLIRRSKREPSRLLKLKS